MSTDGENPVKNRVIFIAAATMVIGGAVGCSSGPAAAKFQSGTLPPGAARLTVSGKDATTGAVQCWTAESLTTITMGTEVSGATVMVSNAEKPIVEFVTVRDLSGFVGNYNLGLEGNATVAMTGATYEITGTVRGYNPTSIEPTTEPFTIKVSC